MARGLRDVAVRGSTVKSSADLAPALRDILDKTEIGKLTPPEVTTQGIEVYAVCRREKSSAENTPDKRKVRDELVNEQFQAKAQALHEGIAQPSHDRVPADSDVATSGADAGRARRDRPRHHAGGLAAPRRTQTAAVLRHRRSEKPGAPRQAAWPRRCRSRWSSRRTRPRPSRRRCRWSTSSCRPAPNPALPTPTARRAAIASIDRAIADVIGGVAAAVVTNPIAKSVLYKSGFAEPGHTEYLAKRSFELTGDPAWPVMMLWSPEVAVVPVTIHLPFKDVPERLTRDLIFETGRVVAHDLTRPLRHRAPAARGRGPQSARRRGRHARQGGQQPSCSRRSSGWSPTASTRAARCRPTPCSTKRRARPTTPRSACITTRR